MNPDHTEMRYEKARNSWGRMTGIATLHAGKMSCLYLGMFFVLIMICFGHLQPHELSRIQYVEQIVE
jgi:hypothetical protein